MMKLQDAIDLLTDDKYRPPEITDARFLVLNAARRVATPDLEAMGRVNFKLSHNAYTDAQLQSLLDAALGITEDE